MKFCFSIVENCHSNVQKNPSLTDNIDSSICEIPYRLCKPRFNYCLYISPALALVWVR